MGFSLYGETQGRMNFPFSGCHQISKGVPAHLPELEVMIGNRDISRQLPSLGEVHCLGIQKFRPSPLSPYTTKRIQNMFISSHQD